MAIEYYGHLLSLTVPVKFGKYSRTGLTPWGSGHKLMRSLSNHPMRRFLLTHSVHIGIFLVTFKVRSPYLPIHMQWTFKEKPDKEKVVHMCKSLDIDARLAGLLVQRGIDTFDKAKQFFRPSLNDLHDPYLMRDMDKAVSRLERALEKGENVLIYGDYDVDGTTSVALLYTYLKTRYENLATYIPDRYTEGYGISYQAIDFAHDNDVSLIIALDCGIKAVEKVAYASEKGIDFIICDHHRPGDLIPSACAVLDPKREDCPYPYKELCGCGIGFKLVQALAMKQGQDISHLETYLDLVATAIAADIVPITGENRILAHFGLRQINRLPRPGIRAIVHQLQKSSLNITDVVFIIAPRINAAGRMEHGQAAVNLLTETSFSRALVAAQAIDRFNTDRKELDKAITEEALQQIADNGETEHFTSVVYKEDWHKGVIGIVASRLIETYYRPTLVFTKSGEKLAASARSVKGFDVYEALDQCSRWIEQFGGHKYAAGLTLLPENYQGFKAAFEEVVRNSLTEEMLSPQLQIDSVLDLADISPKFLRILKQFGPFGPGNMKPVFMTAGLRDNGFGKRVGANGELLKLQILSGPDRHTWNAIGFGLGDHIELIRNGAAFQAAFTLEENHWNGITSLQLNLKDLKEED